MPPRRPAPLCARRIDVAPRHRLVRLHTGESSMDKTPFEIDIPQATIDELRRRVAHTRWPIDFANDQWAYGTNLAHLKELAGYWADGYDWYRHQREMNSYANYKATIQ